MTIFRDTTFLAPARQVNAVVRRTDTLGLPAGCGIAEQIHLVFFPVLQNAFVVGSEFNFYGPRVTALRTYLAQKATDVCAPITIKPIYRKDIIERIARFEDVRLFDVGVHFPSVRTSQLNSLPFFGALKAAAEASGADDV